MCSWSKLTKKQASRVQFKDLKLSEISINPVLKCFLTKETELLFGVFGVFIVCLYFGFGVWVFFKHISTEIFKFGARIQL